MVDSELSNELQVKSFSALLDKCIRATPEEELLVIFDESLMPFFESLVEVVTAKDISTTFINIPKRYQYHMAKNMYVRNDRTLLPSSIGFALNNCTAILSMLDGELATAHVRRAILQHSRSSNCRLAHIPGLSEEIISIVARSDFDEISKASELLAWMLGCCETAQLITYDFHGHNYFLNLGLGGWKNEPLMSPGLILQDSWGNVPPGETFCCPDPSSINGQVCINGSVTGCVLSNGDDIILTFKDGRLVEWTPLKESPAEEFSNRQKADAVDRGDENWNVFAELGIGLNPAISKLTGKSLFDEKALNTIHVAIGDNTVFGHDIKSDRHADLVTWHPSLILNNLEIITRGVLAIDAIAKNRENWVPPEIVIEDNSEIRISEADIHVENGILYRRLCKANRVGIVKMVEDLDVNKALLDLSTKLIQHGKTSYAKLIAESPQIGTQEVSYLLRILDYFDCINSTRI